MDIRKAFRGVGRILIGAGILILLFVVYQLAGTSLAESRSQKALKRQFAGAAAHPGPKRDAPTSPPATAQQPAPTTVPAARPAPPVGDAVAILSIPKIGVNVAVVEGVGVPDLKKGPGHYPKTPLPGQPGNTAIAGHRTTYGAPFYHLDEIATGDVIDVVTHTGSYRYQVLSQRDVLPTDVSVIDATPDNRLTLTTCTPRFSAEKRLIVVAGLVGPATAPPSAPPTKPSGRSTPATSATRPGELPAGEAGSLSGQRQGVVPAVFWGALTALIALFGWAWSRRWRRWAAYILTTPVFLLSLYVFFENFARFLPANI